MKDVEKMYFDGYRNRAMYGDFVIEDERLHSIEAKSEPWKFYLDESMQNETDAFLSPYQNQIEARVRFLNLQGMITNGRTSTIFLGFGHDLNQGAKMREHWAWNTLYGVPLYQSQIDNPMVMGQSLGIIMGCEPLEKIQVMAKDGTYLAKDRPFSCRPSSQMQLSLLTPEGRLGAIDTEVVGLVDAGYQEVDGKLITLSLESAQNLLQTKKISFQTIKFSKDLEQKKVVAEFDQRVRSKYPFLRMIRWQNHPAGELFAKTMSLLSVFRNFVIIVILSISVLSVMNTMVKIVKERTREIGTLLSLGFQKWQVGLIFVFEAVLLGLIGSGFGALGSIVFSSAINQLGLLYRAGMLSEPVLFQIQIVWSDYVFVVTMLVIVTALTAALSVQGALKRRIVESLSHS